MEIREYDMMTDEARGIRTAVFVVEKDYRPEFDEWDEPGRATHLLAFGNGRAVATCRLYPDLDHADQPGRWVIGRLAVVADERGHGIGKTVLAEAERLIRKAGGHVAAVHSEDKNFAMYEHLGYRITSELFDNGTHGWLVKALKLNPEEAAITCESVRHAVSGDGRIWHNRHLAENLGFYRRSPMV